MPSGRAPGIRPARDGHPRNLLSQLRTEGTDVTDLPTDLTRATAAALADALASKTISSVEVTQAHLDRIAAVDGQVHSYLHVDSRGRPRPGPRGRRATSGRARASAPLAGVPIAVKDVMTTKGVPTTCGSRILEGWIPPYDATVVTKLREAGLPILGKTNMDEFAMGSSTEHSAYGPSHNPWDLDRIPGGSGGGSSSVLASFQAPLATGTDTGGSIRQPAAVTGDRRHEADLRRRLALRPRRARQLARPGRPVRPHGARHRAAARRHGRPRPDGLDVDRRTRPAGRRGGPRRRRARACGSASSRSSAARATSPACAPASTSRSPCSRSSVPRSSRSAARTSTTPSRPTTSSSRARRRATSPSSTRCATACACCPRASTPRAPSRSWPPRATPASAPRSSAASSSAPTPSAPATTTRTTARRRRSARSSRRTSTRRSTQVDVLVSPTAPTTAFKLGDKLDDPMAMYLNDIATIPANLAGVPGMSIPSGLADEDGLPAGIQILAPAHEGRAPLLRGRRPRGRARRPLGRSDPRPRARAGRRCCCEGSLT